jgi:hypothetical protein
MTRRVIGAEDAMFFAALQSGLSSVTERPLRHTVPVDTLWIELGTSRDGPVLDLG